jgi:hypothetical protein
MRKPPPPGPPFSNNSDEVADDSLRTHWTTNLDSTVTQIFISHDDADHTEWSAWITATRADGHIIPPNLLLTPHHGSSKKEQDSLEPPNESGTSEPPLMAEFLLKFFARSRNDKFVMGDILELYIRNSVERGRLRAVWLYWADVLGYVSRHAFKTAALITMIKRLFS